MLSRIRTFGVSRVNNSSAGSGSGAALAPGLGGVAGFAAGLAGFLSFFGAPEESQEFNSSSEKAI